MKIKQEDYTQLKNGIACLVEYNGLGLVQAYYKQLIQCDTVEDKKVRLMWDLMRLANLSSYVNGTLYQYLHDTHITTALLKIGSELNIY